MLAFFGLTIIVVLLGLIMTKKMTPLVALIVIPFAGALVAGILLRDTSFFLSGFSPTELSHHVLDGLRSIIPAAGMFVFAILFFGVISDAGMLDPIIGRIIRMMGNRPTRITMGSVLITLIIHLDGSGAVTFMLAVPALLPLYDRLGMDRRVLACVLSMAAGVNVLPWVGPMIRSSAVMQVPATDIFVPLIPVQIVGLATVFAFAWWLGKREERRLGSALSGMETESGHLFKLSDEQKATRRPHMFWPNIVLTFCVITFMVMNWLDAAVSFMLGTAIALVINYPDVAMQKARVDAHARPALMMASILMGAGVFVGIMKGTGMIQAMSMAAVSAIPESMGQHIPFTLGLISMPLSLFFDPDSYYFGVMPIIAEVYRAMGGDPIHVAQASLLGVLTTGFPVSPMTPSTFLLVALCRIELGEHQKFTIPFLWVSSIIMTLAAALFGVFPW